MAYPERISRFKRWARLKVESGKVGLGDKAGYSTRLRHRRRRKRRARRRKALWGD